VGRRLRRLARLANGTRAPFPQLIGALAHLGLGRAYALSGDSANAEAAYPDFFALWKDADPGIPILKQAKAEYAKLRRFGRKSCVCGQTNLQVLGMPCQSLAG
jgi:hypothetical protein